MEIFEDFAKMILVIALLVSLGSLLVVPAFSGYEYADLNALGAIPGKHVPPANIFASYTQTFSDYNTSFVVYFKDNTSDTTSYAELAMFVNATRFSFENNTYDTWFITFDKPVYVGKTYVILKDASGVSQETVFMFDITDANYTALNFTINISYLKSRIAALSSAYVVFVVGINPNYLTADELYTATFKLAKSNSIDALIYFAFAIFTFSVVLSYAAKELGFKRDIF